MGKPALFGCSRKNGGRSRTSRPGSSIEVQEDCRPTSPFELPPKTSTTIVEKARSMAIDEAEGARNR